MSLNPKRETFREPLSPVSRNYHQDTVMKALLTTRPEVRWAAVAIPALFFAHWLLTGLCVEVLRLVPSSVRAVLHLL